MQIFKGLTAQEFSANLMARSGLAFDQRNLPSLAGQRDSSGAACYATAEDENFILYWNLIQIGRCNWNLLVRILYLKLYCYFCEQHDDPVIEVWCGR
jgi:hypothetical protein